MNYIDGIIKAEATRRNVRMMFPVMIHWAKTGQNDHTYGELINCIGMVRFSGIGHALYSVQSVLDALSKDSGVPIPTLNSLCKNAKTHLPSEGFEFVSPKYNDLDDNGKRIFVKGLDEEAISFQHWNWVLQELGLEEYQPISEKDLQAIKQPRFSTGGEGAEHKALKEYILQHPESLGYKDVVFSETEHILPSGDRLDVYFKLADETNVCIEVKPSKSPEDEINRGIFQCVKYEAVMEALRTIECANYDIEVRLVTTGTFSSLNKKLAEELFVDYVDDFTANIV